jgi:hypothetical protein
METNSNMPTGSTVAGLFRDRASANKAVEDLQATQYGSVKGERERGKGIKNSFTLYPLPFPHSPNSKLKMLNRTVLAGDRFRSGSDRAVWRSKNP